MILDQEIKAYIQQEIEKKIQEIKKPQKNDFPEFLKKLKDLLQHQVSISDNLKKDCNYYAWLEDMFLTIEKNYQTIEIGIFDIINYKLFLPLKKFDISNKDKMAIIPLVIDLCCQYQMGDDIYDVVYLLMDTFTFDEIRDFMKEKYGFLSLYPLKDMYYKYPTMSYRKKKDIFNHFIDIMEYTNILDILEPVINENNIDQVMEKAIYMK